MAMVELHLALLLSGPRHGYDVKRAYDNWFPDERPLAFGQVYATLARLVRDGLAEVVETRVEGGPERTVYGITPDGRERLASWLDEPAPPAGGAGEDIVRKTVAALHGAAGPSGAAAVVTRQRAAHLRRMRELSGVPPAAPGDSASTAARRLARRHRVLHLDADLRWLAEAVDTLGTGSATTRDPHPSGTRAADPQPGPATTDEQEDPR